VCGRAWLSLRFGQVMLGHGPEAGTFVEGSFHASGRTHRVKALRPQSFWSGYDPADTLGKEALVSSTGSSFDKFHWEFRVMGHLTHVLLLQCSHLLPAILAPCSNHVVEKRSVLLDLCEQEEGSYRPSYHYG
jgi:hypothetical protein